MRKLFLSAFASLASIAYSQAYLDDVMLQSFGWDEYNQPSSGVGFYNYIKSQSATYKAAGFDMIWLPPPSDSGGGVGYMPRELNNFTKTIYGTQAELTSMLSTLKNDGIHPITDVVVNHRIGTTNWTDFTNPSWGCSSITSTDEANYNYVPSRGQKPCGDADTGDDFDGARDLNHNSTEVQAGIKQFLTNMKNLGFEGWRWDMVKGFSGYYVGNYDSASQPYYSVGEYWDGNTAAVTGWINATNNGGYKSGAFDFPLYYILSGALKNNSYAGLSGHPGLAGQYGYSQYAVTFVDNHDTFVKPEYFSGDDIIKGYAYILTHPGIPCVFICHYKGGTYTKDGVTRTYANYSAIINELMKIRKDNGINANSNLNVVAAQNDLYAATIDDKVALKIGNTAWSPSGTGWTQAASYLNGFVRVFTKSAVNSTPTLSVSPAGGNFSAGTTVTVNMSATDTLDPAPKIYYTLNGTTPTANSTLYTAPIAISTTTTVNAIAVNNQGKTSAVASNLYNIATSTGGSFTVYFKPPASWTSAPKIYYWNATPTESLANATWPGVTMSAACDGWYYYTFKGQTSSNVIFNNGSSGTSNQTPDLSANKTSFYDWNSQSWLSTSPITNPCFTMTASASYNDGTTATVSLSASSATVANPTIYYTIDGSTPTTASSSFTNSGTLSFTKTTTVKAYAKTSDGESAVKTSTFTFNPVSGITVHFKPNPTATGWSGKTPKVYYWNVVGGNVPATTWPGIIMTSEGNGWYKYSFAGVTSLNAIFNNGSSGVNTNQTPDIIGITKEIWYDWNTKSYTTTLPSGKINPSFVATDKNSVSIAPNPASEYIAITGASGYDSYSINDSSGKTIIKRQINPDEKIFIKQLPAGLYTITLYKNNNTYTQRFIKK